VEEGEYQTDQAGEVIEVLAPVLDEATPPRTPISALFAPDDSADPEEIQRRRARCAEQLLNRTNRLLRWYRAVSRRADVTELTRAQVSPFQFAASGAAPPAWLAPLQYESPGQPAPLDAAQISAVVHQGLATGREPGVAELFLLDAERALHLGRFREAVLFCWSTIDSVFNQKYDQLANSALDGEWAVSREFLTGVDYGLRHKMSAGMHLFANRSLFREPNELWNRMTASYNRRNAIIHRGENATEEEARQAIDVARRIVEIMNSIHVPAAGAGVPPSPPADTESASSGPRRRRGK
jgi:hypothetical protein